MNLLKIMNNKLKKLNKWNIFNNLKKFRLIRIFNKKKYKKKIIKLI